MMNAGSAAPGGGSSTAGISINIEEMRRETGDNSAIVNQIDLQDEINYYRSLRFLLLARAYES